MKKIAILGSTGMVGSMLYNILKEDFNLVIFFRKPENLRKLYQTYGKAKVHKAVHFDLTTLENLAKFKDLLKHLNLADVVINAAGIIKPLSLRDVKKTYLINSALPQLLSIHLKERLFHISTDCVFSGETRAPYFENTFPSPVDLYGLTKMLGEPYKDSFVIRTSIIGPEIANYLSLLEWSKRQKEVLGFTNHYWNGITSKELARICRELINNPSKFPKKGLYHIFSTSLSKYQILEKFKLKYKLKITIKPTKDKRKIDRRLASDFNFYKQLRIPEFDVMLSQL